jgi:hypothetical protein
MVYYFLVHSIQNLYNYVTFIERNCVTLQHARRYCVFILITLLNVRLWQCKLH